MWKIQLFKLNYDNREVDAVKDVVESGWITMGEKTLEFEKQFSAMLGGGVSSVALSSATAALHISLLSLGIKEGDEIIVPALTFVADINAVLMVGGTPILADCDSYVNWNVSAKSIAKVITFRTKAVILVHYAGYPVDMDEVVSLCDDRGITIIEDCAHAPGAKYNGQSVGTFGQYGCFSFFTNKNLSVGEGGMLTTKDRKLEQQARYFRSHGMTTLTLDRHKGRAITYDVIQAGLNYRIDEMRSALGLVQLDKLANANARRGSLVRRYIENLSEEQKISVPFVNMSNVEPVYHIFPILLAPEINRSSLIEQLKLVGIQSSIHYPAFKGFSAFNKINLKTAQIAEDIARRELTLPLYPTMSLREVDTVCNNLKEILGEL